MISELSSILITAISSVTGTGGIAGILLWRHNKKMRELERQLKDSEVKLKDSEVSKARIESKGDEFHLLQEVMEYTQQELAALKKESVENEEWWRERDAKKDAKNEELTLIIREQRSTLAAKDEQIQAEKDLNTEYERVISELTEENTYLNLWACHKAECDNGVPPRGRLKGMKFDLSRLVRTGQRLKLLENKHKNGINLNKE